MMIWPTFSVFILDFIPIFFPPAFLIINPKKNLQLQFVVGGAIIWPRLTVLLSSTGRTVWFVIIKLFYLPGHGLHFVIVGIGTGLGVVRHKKI